MRLSEPARAGSASANFFRCQSPGAHWPQPQAAKKRQLLAPQKRNGALWTLARNRKIVIFCKFLSHFGCLCSLYSVTLGAIRMNMSLNVRLHNACAADFWRAVCSIMFLKKYTKTHDITVNYSKNLSYYMSLFKKAAFAAKNRFLELNSTTFLLQIKIIEIVRCYNIYPIVSKSLRCSQHCRTV